MRRSNASAGKFCAGAIYETLFTIWIEKSDSIADLQLIKEQIITVLYNQSSSFSSKVKTYWSMLLNFIRKSVRYATRYGEQCNYFLFSKREESRTERISSDG